MRFAVVDCEDSERWRGYTFRLWRQAFYRDGDTWAVFNACHRELPPVAEAAAAFDAVIVGGSHHGVHDDEQQRWIAPLLAWLREVAHVPAPPRIFGCCFGCQALAVALGGSVGPNPGGRFVLTLERVQPTPQLAQFKQLHAVVQEALADAAAAAQTAAAAQGTAGVSTSSTSTTSSSTTSSSLTARVAGCSITSSSSSSSSVGGPSTSTDTIVAAGGAPPPVTSPRPASEQPPPSPQPQQPDATSKGLQQRASNTCSTPPPPQRQPQDCSATTTSSSCCFRLIESHGDQVLALPPGGTCLASSATAANELWVWGASVLCTQHHLEFTEALVLEKIWPRLTALGRLDAQESAASAAALRAGGQDNVAMLRVVRRFLEYGAA